MSLLSNEFSVLYSFTYIVAIRELEALYESSPKDGKDSEVYYYQLMNMQRKMTDWLSEFKGADEEKEIAKSFVRTLLSHHKFKYDKELDEFLNSIKMKYFK